MFDGKDLVEWRGSEFFKFVKTIGEIADSFLSAARNGSTYGPAVIFDLFLTVIPFPGRLNGSGRLEDGLDVLRVSGIG